MPLHRNYTSAKGFAWWVNDPGPRTFSPVPPAGRPPPGASSGRLISQAELLKAVLLDPPASLRQIIDTGRTRERLSPSRGSPTRDLSTDLPELPPLDGRSDYLLKDPGQQRDALWTEFQTDVRYRFEHRHDPPPPPPPPPPRHTSNRGPKVKKREPPPPPPEPQDWTGKVALALHNIMKAQHQKVDNVFRKFDTDGSGELDASEFHGALLELALPESLAIPDDDVSRVLQEVFDTMDGDGNGVLSFKEINKYLRAGRHEVQLEGKLQAGAVAVQAAGVGVQAHRTRRKEEWKALDRFATLDVTKSGAATMRELLAFFLSEGYDESFVKSLMAALDVDSDGSITAEEWRAGVSRLRGSSLLMSMTDPIEPPSGETFKDLGRPREVAPFLGYTKALKFSSSISPVTEAREGKFCRGCEIPLAEHRGIMLKQLRAICEHVHRRCIGENWVNTDGERLEGRHVTMYDCAAYVIKPATRKKKNSLVEHIARGPQTPTWFVSHWWGLPLFELVACLEQHARDRQLDPNTTTYWISAFALSQWQLECPVGKDPERATYRRAMALCNGTVACVERGGEAYFGRVWCVYEVGLALGLSRAEGSAHLFDLYSAHTHKVRGELLPQRAPPTPGRVDAEGGEQDGGAPAPSAAAAAAESERMNFCPGHLPLANPNQKGPAEATEQRHAVGLTEGLCASDLHAQSKTAREAHFPSAVLERALHARIQGGASSVESDRVHILNALAGAADLDATPAASHASYSEVNGRIRAAIATSCMVRAAIAAAQNDSRMFDALCEGLSESSLRRVDIDFTMAVNEGVNVPYKVFDIILSSLPPTTEEVAVTLPASVTRLPPNKLKGLPLLHTLEIHDCVSLEVLPDDLTECFALTSIDLTNCVRLADLPKRLFDLRRLKSLNLTNCNTVRTLHARGVTKSPLETLILQDCSGFTELPEALGYTLGALQLLNLRGCTALSKVPRWVNDMEKGGVAVMRPYHLE